MFSTLATTLGTERETEKKNITLVGGRCHTAGEIDTAFPLLLLLLPPLASKPHFTGEPSSPKLPPTRGLSGEPPTPRNRGENARADLGGWLGMCFPV
jgi:hypothetical protein